MTDIFLDNNIFDFLYNNNIDITKEFPKDKFRLCISKEIKFETEPIKEHKKKSFIKNLVDSHIAIVSFFGFYNESHSDEKQRIGGFDEGVFSTVENESYRKELSKKFLKQNKNPKNDLYKEEADIDLAVRSISNIVLTLDEKKKKKKGPLNDAYERGYKIVFLTDFDVTKESLYHFVESSLKKRMNEKI